MEQERESWNRIIDAFGQGEVAHWLVRARWYVCRYPDLTGRLEGLLNPLYRRRQGRREGAVGLVIRSRRVLGVIRVPSLPLFDSPRSVRRARRVARRYSLCPPWFETGKLV